MNGGPSQDAAGVAPLLAAYYEKRANLVRYLAARTGSLAVAEDLAQELYLRVARLEPDHDAESPVAFLYKAAANLAADHLRGARRAAERERRWTEDNVIEFAGRALAAEPAADDAFAARQRLTALIQAVDELAPQMGRAFRLHKLEGLSHAETARAMGISVKAVEKHVSAALKALTRKLSA
jgi:RNA polymerase sigma-70 factor (ECF subfamily)